LSFQHGSLLNIFDQIETLSWMTRVALELIGQGGLGYSFDPLTEDGKKHVLCKAANEVGCVPLDVAHFSY